MLTIFCPTCHELMLDQPACPACGWRRPPADGSAGAQLWQAELGHRLSKPRCYPALAAGRYCVATEDGLVVAFDPQGGQPTWERALAERHIAHALTSDGQRVFVGCVDTRPIPVPGASFLAIDAHSGEPSWEYATGGHSLSAAVALGDTVFFTSSDGLLHCIDARTGQKRWSAAHPAWGPEAPAASAGVICAGGRGEALVARSPADGTELWHFIGDGWFAGELCIADGQLYTVCWDGYLYVLDERSGRLLWKASPERDKGFTSPPTVTGERVFIGSRVYRSVEAQRAPAYALVALRAADGAELWRFYTDRHVFAPPIVAGDTLLFGADDGSFYALDAPSGAERWRAQVDGRIVAQPLVDGDRVCVGTRGGTIYVFRWRSSSAEPPQPPGAYLERGEHEQAAVAYALDGQPEAAAAIYEQRLGRPREAALLYERAGQPGKAAPLWERLGELRRARDRYSEASDTRGLATVLAQLGEPLQAAHLYEEAGSVEPAARLYEQAGNRVRAAELYDQAGQYQRARAIWESLGRWERQVDDLVHEGRAAEAAALLLPQGQQERAADLYEQAGELRHALQLRVKLAHWERAAVLAARLGDDEQAAEAYDQLRQLLPAAEAYERAAQQATTVHAPEERAAALYERAAQRYTDLGEEERAANCRRQVRRCRQLPEVTVAGAAEEAFVEQQWNALSLRVENSGYGPAHAVTLAMRGDFDVEGDLHIPHLSPKKPVVLEVSMRPHLGQYGPKVPLEIVVRYADACGGQYEVAQRHPVHVRQKGAEYGSATPWEIRVRDQQAPRRSATHSQEEVNRQRELLETHRRRLAVLLIQQAQVGLAYTPPGVTLDIAAARAEIRRIKAVLRRWGVPVEDNPDDEAWDSEQRDREDYAS